MEHRVGNIEKRGKKKWRLSLLSGQAARPELNIHLKLPIIQFCYSYKLTLLFKPFSPIIQVI